MAIVNLTLRINYYANGGSGAPSASITRIKAIESDLPKTLRAEVSRQIPTRDGYYLLGWALSASASSASYSAGDVLSHQFNSWTGNDQEYTYNLYAVWQARTYYVTYSPGIYGSGSTVVDSKSGGSDLTLRGQLFTRTGYRQTGWSTNAAGSGFAYSLGGKYSANLNITLYPYWSIIKSTITSVTDSVPADGATQGTVAINRPNSDFTHTVTISLGTRSAEYTNVGTSLTFTIPTAWLDQIPNATSAVATVSLTTYKNGSQVGTPDTKSFVITVPDAVVPTISLTGANQSNNSTVSGWDILLQGYSQIALTATVAAGNGASVASIAFSGEGVSQIGADTSVTSELLTSAGSKTWTAIVTDSRGRTATATLTRTVHEYYPAAILAFSAFRSTQEGNASPSGGQYITASGNYSFASCDGHNSASVKKIEYKMHTDTSWTQGEGSAASGTVYTFGTISLLYIYDVRMTITDSLGSTSAYTVNVASVRGVSFGLNGRCARFGGPVQYDDRFECDWDMQVDGQVEMPLFLQTGVVVSENIASDTTKTIDIVFETEFETQPYVAVSIMSPQTTGLDACAVTAWNITKTGFSARLINGYEATRQLGLCWIATARKNVNVGIITQPTNQTADVGDRVTFTVEAVNATGYQWYSREPFGDDWEAISGDVAKYADYIFEAIAAKNGYRYKCVASNNKGSVESNEAALTINGAGPIGIMDTAPYVFRKSAGGVSIGNRLLDSIIGGTVAWNQLAPYPFTAVTETGYTAFTNGTPIIIGHKYFVMVSQSGLSTNASMSIDCRVSGSTKSSMTFSHIERSNVSYYISEASYSGVSNGTTNNNDGNVKIYANFAQNTSGTVDGVTMCDLTSMFGSSIADYLYTLESGTAGAGIDWLKSYGFFTEPYYAYDVGGLQSVNTSAHRMVGFNLLNDFLGYKSTPSGVTFNTDNAVRVINGMEYEFNHGDVSNATTWRHAVVCYDLKGTKMPYSGLITAGSGGMGYNQSGGYYVNGSNGTRTSDKFTPNFDGYIIPFIIGGNASASTTVQNPCVHLVGDGERDGEYEAYTEHIYPLDSDLTLRGIPKLDASNNLYYDGDEYASDGTVTRKYGIRAYTSGDATDGSTMITDGTNTVYALSEPTTETAEPFTNPQIVDPDGTEEYVDYAQSQNLRDVSIPVGHETYYKNPS